MRLRTKYWTSVSDRLPAKTYSWCVLDSNSGRQAYLCTTPTLSFCLEDALGVIYHSILHVLGLPHGLHYPEALETLQAKANRNGASTFCRRKNYAGIIHHILAVNAVGRP